MESVTHHDTITNEITLCGAYVVKPESFHWESSQLDFFPSHPGRWIWPCDKVLDRERKGAGQGEERKCGCVRPKLVRGRWSRPVLPLLPLAWCREGQWQGNRRAGRQRKSGSLEQKQATVSGAESLAAVISGPAYPDWHSLLLFQAPLREDHTEGLPCAGHVHLRQSSLLTFKILGALFYIQGN